MNEGIVQSSSVQQMVGAGSNNWFTTNSLLAATSPPPNHTPHHSAPPLSWAVSQELPHSWSQLVLGFGGEEDKGGLNHMQLKNVENWEQQLVSNSSISSADAKRENSAASYAYGAGNLEFTATSTNCLSPPKSCVTTSSMCTDMFGFSSKSSEILMKCNGGAAKKSKMNPTTSAQSGIKVRKEKLGDRITALHQLVSPFGKTDTASVLLEAIGYIRFLQRQIEALSLPYLATGSGNITHQQPVKRESGSCLFPEHPGQLLNESQRKRKAISEEECDEEAKKDLKSRGLCLVPLSCTVDFGSENGADYWAPSFAGNFQ
ncbi:transcription factor bHLH68-like [Salvia miltiorrhiza]|uniref:transcription factor bHLH68-like n=1 Tax=Salvia miltiorrhiza TaxID=226208 RepID=UPI0025ACA2E1|nr:transcription factor bHLH68-like [Salvia miltiorrhiza]